MLKVVTNYLADSVHLVVTLGEALATVAKAAGMDLGAAYEAIRISSGNSFVHETESQVILNGSYNINFTMDLVMKDMGLFDGHGPAGWRCRWRSRPWCSTSSSDGREALSATAGLVAR